jgi:hypothetical protein
MTVEKTTLGAAGMDQKQWYRVGCIAALVLGIVSPVLRSDGLPAKGGQGNHRATGYHGRRPAARVTPDVRGLDRCLNGRTKSA